MDRHDLPGVKAVDVAKAHGLEAHELIEVSQRA
jgi:hypothetical protein